MLDKLLVREIADLEHKSLVLLLKQASSELNICLFGDPDDGVGHSMGHHSGVILDSNVKMQMFIKERFGNSKISYTVVLVSDRVRGHSEVICYEY